ncbi:hypothetical protein SAMN05421548_1014 [Paraburkholderia lycopersici]|uniref:Uncharacterized protein n=2 Tax=Paraburkholderia lycopersici TaxID=416944 RepID=A0A1G6GJK2_9BURK|nr:hypothetical protein SAMN05421548_1014 [Paraburkholderia lycopersici]
MRIQSVGIRPGLRVAVLACGAAAALMGGNLHAASEDAGQEGQSLMLESDTPVALYQTANSPAVVMTAPGDAFPLRAQKADKRYRVHYNGGVYYVNPLDVSVRQSAKVVCAKAPTKTLASRFGAGSDECNK